MSLINDALKRAKATQPKVAAPAAGPALRPAPAPRRGAGGNDFLLPAVIVIILLLAGLLIWQWFRGEAGDVKVRAKMISTPDAVQPAPVPAPIAVPAPQPPVVAPPVTPTVPQATTNAYATNEPAAPAAPLPITYKLQTIFYRAKNPSAVINGKTVFPGTKVGDARVIAIDKESATIVTAAGQTNVLELP